MSLSSSFNERKLSTSDRSDTSVIINKKTQLCHNPYFVPVFENLFEHQCPLFLICFVIRSASSGTHESHVFASKQLSKRGAACSLARLALLSTVADVLNTYRGRFQKWGFPVSVEKDK